MGEGRLLRFAAPPLYNLMIGALSEYRIEPNDVLATLEINENGFDVIIRCHADFSQAVTRNFRPEQTIYPDEEVTRFFKNAAQQCHSLVNVNYYKMI